MAVTSLATSLALQPHQRNGLPHRAAREPETGRHCIDCALDQHEKSSDSIGGTPPVVLKILLPCSAISHATA